MARQVLVEDLCLNTVASSVIIWELYWSQDRENEKRKDGWIERERETALNSVRLW